MNKEKGVTCVVVPDDYSPKLPEGKLSEVKIVYCIRKVQRKLCTDLRPDLDGYEGKYILSGEHYVHGGWYPITTSLVLNYDEANKAYETLNSVYRVID